MYIRELKLYNFRNLANQTVAFSPTLNVIVGPNGQGKTNLVEAIFILGLSRSFRTSSSSELIRWGESACSVFATIAQKSSDVELGLSIGDGAKKAFVNGDEVPSVADLVGRLLCVSFSPSDLDLVSGGPQVRRRFIDKLIVDLRPSLFRSLVNYQRALKNKNAALKIGADERALDAFDAIMAEEAERITSARVESLHELEKAANDYHDTISAGRGAVRIELKSGLLKREARGKEEIFRELRAARGRELHMKVATLGPHRDDIEILLDGKEAQAFASQGQSRSIVLALKLAVVSVLETRRGEAPVVLLDDVDSELDSQRSQALFDLVSGLNTQICVTGTRVAAALEGARDDLRVMRLFQGEVSS